MTVLSFTNNNGNINLENFFSIQRWPSILMLFQKFLYFATIYLREKSFFFFLNDKIFLTFFLSPVLPLEIDIKYSNLNKILKTKENRIKSVSFTFT